MTLKITEYLKLEYRFFFAKISIMFSIMKGNLLDHIVRIILDLNYRHINTMSVDLAHRDARDTGQ